MKEIDKDTLIRASQGDIQAFEEIYKTSSSFVYNVALRIVNNREDALEVSQDVFMTIYHKLKGFRFESSFKTWVYRITANSAINFAKKFSRTKTVPFEEALGEGAVLNEAQAHMDQEHQNQLVESLLGELSPDQRACVVLRDIQGLSYEEIARALNININTVRSRLKRSREKLLGLRETSMTKFKKALLGVTVGFIVAAFPLAHAENPGPDGTSAKGHSLPRQQAGGQRFEEIYSQLNLTDVQRKQLEANKHQHRTRMERARQEMKMDKEELKEELMKPQLDMPKIYGLHRQIKVLLSQMEDVKLSSILAVRSILTPEQFSKFVNLMSKHKQEHEGK
jgi:RNA polymerase sigma-70 factor (ECF subfamily)